MHRSIVRIIIGVAMALGLVFAAGCAWCKGRKSEEGAATRVSLAELSVPARATVEKLTAGGQIERIDREVERGKDVYDLEATVNGRHVEYVIAEADGAVLGTETEIAYGDLPAAVRAAAEKYFDSTTGLKAMKGEEYGETSYEIEGLRGGKKTEASFDPAGKKIE